jgi:uncharacterized RDD family membrane protein YckC
MSKTITIKSSTGEITYELAPFGLRLAARLIDSIIIIIPNSIIPLLPAWLYWAFQQSSESQATIGQKAVKIKVVDIHGDKISFGQATGRFFGHFLNIMTFFLGYFMFFFNAKNQCLHDLLSSCVVVREDEISKVDDILNHLIES